MKKMSAKSVDSADKRRYIRLNSVFPVGFRLVSADGKRFLSDWIQGFTNNIGHGGICLSVNNLPDEMVQLIAGGQVKLSLYIEMPLSGKKINAQARVIWAKSPVREPEKYLIGLAYEEIARRDNNRIFFYAVGRKSLPRIVLLLFFILVLTFSISGYLNIKLIQANKALIGQLINILQKSSIAKQDIKKLFLPEYSSALMAWIP